MSSAIHVVPAEQFAEGGGFIVRRPFPVHGLSHVDPFLLIDEMGPVNYAPGEAIGAPDHPHRGFETVTYIIDGQMDHEDSFGHRGSIRSGDVQWMTAGAGVIHSEMPGPQILRDGGRMHGFQIWVNLPREKKMMQPHYQEYSSAALPVVEGGGRWIRIVAGTYAGKRSPIETTIPATMLHVKLQPGIEAAFDVAPGSNVIVHAVAGNGTVDGNEADEHHAAIVLNSNGRVTLRAGEAPYEALVLAGMPIGEPVARYGPFVMNSRGELEQAFDDFRNGKFGSIARIDTDAAST
ncbi:MAG TPA: pirin family protein [Candidatus Aquilonibacter sp.]|nr:pirin family protein [Candidatus Aquilonibacter sp.]